MIFFGLELIGFAILFYSLKELCSTKNYNDIIVTTNNYQPPPRYEEINQSG